MALEIYRPDVATGAVYFHNAGKAPALKYNHDVDLVRFKGRFLASWNANETGAEGVPGQYNFLSISADFKAWTTPVRLFSAEAGCENPVDSDNQWQPAFINLGDETLYCAWCDFIARKVYISESKDGIHWKNREVANSPASLSGLACGFPTNHGLRTRSGVLLFPCSLPFTDTPRGDFGRTRYAGMLMSRDGGAHWEWSEPIEAISWAEIEDASGLPGGDLLRLWEPSVYEEPDGTLALLIRNASSMSIPERKPHDKPHHMLLHARSRDQGRTWEKARPVEVDTIISRNFACSAFAGPASLLMVMNDWKVGIPQNIPHDRYFLSLYFSPTCDPDLLLPGPVVQPDGGWAFYPNGFVENGVLYLAYTYSGIYCTAVKPLPDFSRPFLLPRGSRSGLRLEGDLAHFEQKWSTLGLVLTEALTRAPRLRLSFRIRMDVFRGPQRMVLSMGGKTRSGTAIRACFDEASGENRFEARLGGAWRSLGPLRLGAWHAFAIELAPGSVEISVDGVRRRFDQDVLRKIAFGGLYEAPDWPMGMAPAGDMVLDLPSIEVS